MCLFRLQLRPLLLGQFRFHLAAPSAIGHLVALAHNRLFAIQRLVEDFPIMLDNPLRAELVDVFLINVQHLPAEALRVVADGFLSASHSPGAPS